MNSIAKRYFLRATACLMALCLIALCVHGAAGGVTTQAARSFSELTDVTGEYDLGEIHEKYFDRDKVSVNLDASEDVWVIATLDGDGVIDEYAESGYRGEFSEYAESYLGKVSAANMRAEQNKVLGRVEQAGIAYEKKYSYTALVNGVALKVKSGDVEKLRRVEGIEDVWRSERYARPENVVVSNNANAYTTGIYDTHELKDYNGESYQGEGMVVAILDTGLDYTHRAFSEMPTTLGFDRGYVESKLDSLAAFARRPDLTTDMVYINDKVPYAYDYADDDGDVYPSYSSHGTHVAGIVAGKDETKIVDAATGETFVGVAPNAQLAIMKVFTDDLDSRMLGGADSVDILAAVSDCAQLGVDVINMSLGSTGGFSDVRSDEEMFNAYNKVKDAGISLVVAASNEYSSGYGGSNGTNLASNPDSGVVGSPSTYPGALSVASINGKLSPYVVGNPDDSGEGAVAFITSAADGNGNELEFVDGIMKKAAAAGITPDENGYIDLNYIVVGGVGRNLNYTGTIRSALADGNTIAVVKRGDTTFEEKVETAMSYGAMGVIIYNNVSGGIRMSLGNIEDPIPTCSIGMDAGNLLVSGADRRGRGTIRISRSFEAGPFMSDFSSWGPTPDLQLKPEITAHGGEILSSVPGGGYDESSGTSMAAPNMAGAVAILRQYLEKNYPEFAGGDAETKVKLTARVNQLLMSTATMARNDVNDPYSPRKQGAGLAGILDAIRTEGYITVDACDGTESDKTKLELGDDKQRTGKYEMSFTVHNLNSSEALSYRPVVYVMTETLASDHKTVAEKAYMLTDTRIEIEAGGAAVAEGGTVSVPAGGTLDITVKLTLGDEGRRYIEESFVNGMYVEGFVRLEAEEGTVPLGVPFLAFYGDWLDAPLFDYTVYEVSEDEADSAMEEDDKRKATAYASTPLGLYNEGLYILPLGQYLYEMADEDTAIVASDDRAAVSMYDVTQNDASRHTIYELYMVYAGLLRGAKTLDIVVTDVATGEVLYRTTEYNVRKAYANGGSGVGSNIMMNLNPYTWGLKNNSTYNVTLKGTLDGPGETTPAANNDTFSFNFTVDYEAPIIEDYRLRFEPYTVDREVKYRVWVDVDVYDNAYAMTLLPCYIREDRAQGDTLTLLTEYPVPVYGQKGETTTVSFEVTDYYDDYIVPKWDASTGTWHNNFYIAVEDYALNQTVWNLTPEAAMRYYDSISFAPDDKLMYLGDARGYGEYLLNIAPNELYKLNMTAVGNEPHKLSWAGGEDFANVIVEENEIFALKAGSEELTLYADGEVKAIVTVRVSGNALPAPVPESMTLGNAVNAHNWLTDLDGGEIELYANMTVDLTPEIEPWYYKYTDAAAANTFTFESENETVATVTADGILTTHARGASTVWVRSAAGNLAKRVRVRVLDDWEIDSGRLQNYHGGPDAVIPERLNAVYIDEDCFRGNTSLRSVTLSSTITQIPEYAFEGCVNLEKIVIPAACTTIRSYAFAGCTNLREVVLERAEDDLYPDDFDKRTRGVITIGSHAFEGCTNLATIHDETNDVEGWRRITTAYDSAFSGCTSLTYADLTGLRTAGSRVFANCTNLSEVVTGANTAVGRYMFVGCVRLGEIEVNFGSVAAHAFENCSGLHTVTFTGSVPSIGEYAFANTGLSEVALPAGACVLGAAAFGNNASLTSVTLGSDTRMDRTGASPFIGCNALASFGVSGSAVYEAGDDGILYNIGRTRIELVPAGSAAIGEDGSFTPAPGVTSIGEGAFSGITALKTIDLSNITEIGAYAFSGSGLTSVTLGSGVTAVPDGAFDGCRDLASVTAPAVTALGSYAFRNTPRLSSVDMPSVSEIGGYAFASSGLSELELDDVSAVGAYAFSGARVRTVSLGGSAMTLGANAFANASELTSVTLGAVTSMGAYAFSGCNALASVTLGAGTEEIGDYAFVVRGVGGFDENTSLRTVVTGGAKRIGDLAFYRATGLTDIDLGNATEIGEGAFMQATSLTDIDLSSAVTIGTQGFALATGITSLDLTSAVEIGDLAFIGCSALGSVELDALKVLGERAFYLTGLTSFTLPAGFDGFECEDVFTYLNESYREEEYRGKNKHTFGAGTLSAIPTLERIDVAEGNPVFESIDGVLYGRTDAGLTLLAYPAGRKGESYTVAAGTVRIDDFAFERAGMIGSGDAATEISGALKKVTFPYSVERIGAGAFADSSVTGFTFESVEAPALETRFVSYMNYTTYDSSSGQYVLTDLGAAFYNLGGVGENTPPHSSDIYYNNFGSYIALVTERAFIYYATGYDTSYADAQFMRLSLTRPENGKGYDNPVWNTFFMNADNVTLSEYAPERSTRRVMELIAALPTEDDVRAVLSMQGSVEEKRAAIVEMSSARVLPVRREFNAIGDPRQLEFIEGGDSRLLAVEAAVRAVKAELGIPAEMTQLVLVTRPGRVNYYVGESLDLTGMTVKAVFDDGSEMPVSDYTVDKTGPLALEDDRFTVSYGGKDCVVYIAVTERPAEENGGGSGGGSPSAGVIVGLVLGGAAATLAVTFAAVMIGIRKKKNGMVSPDESKGGKGKKEN